VALSFTYDREPLAPAPFARRKGKPMSNFLFFSVLRALGKGRVIRNLMTVLLRALSILTLAAGIYLLYQLLTNGFHEGAPTEAVILALLTILILAVTIVAVAQIFWFRSNSAQEIPDGPFTAIPVFAVLVRAIGEVYACVITAAGLVLCLSIWIAKGAGGLPPLHLPGFDMPIVPIENSFFQGLILLVLILLLAAAYLLFFYFCAEAIVVTVDIAINVRTLLRPGSAPPVLAPPAPQYAPPMAQRCPNCGAEVLSGAPFCGRCGTSLTPPST
jgi:zinc-ribbon domain